MLSQDSGEVSTRLAALPPREREIVKLAVSGCRNQTIADQCGLTLVTVKTELSHALWRLRCRDRYDLRWLLRFGIEPPTRQITWQDLSPQERKLAQYLGSGFKNPTLAKILGLTKKRVGHMVWRLRLKVGCADRSALIKWCAQERARAA